METPAVAGARNAAVSSVKPVLRGPVAVVQKKFGTTGPGKH
jgi:hypothetical protein